jgi:hypothetical protein
MASQMTGISLNRLYTYIENIKEKRMSADAELITLKNRTYAQYLRCLAYETKSKCFGLEESQYREINEKLKRAQEKLKNMRARVRNKREDATNKEVAEVLGVPKGTVDFCVSSMRCKFKGLFTEIKQDAQ